MAEGARIGATQPPAALNGGGVFSYEQSPRPTPPTPSESRLNLSIFGTLSPEAQKTVSEH